MIKSVLKGIAVVALGAVMAGCSPSVVGPTEVGKVISGGKYSDEVLEPGRYFPMIWERMITLDMSTERFDEPMAVKMADDTELKFEISFRGRIKRNPITVNTILSDVTVDRNGSIKMEEVYRIYGRDVVASTARGIVGSYKIDVISSKFEEATRRIQEELLEKLKNSPIEVSNVTIGNIEFPRSIIDNAEQRKTSELAHQIATNRRDLAKVEAETTLIQAQAVRDQNATIAEGLSPLLVEYKRIEALGKLANAGATTIVYPMSNTGDIPTGLQNRIFQK